jgi:carbamate kinase
MIPRPGAPAGDAPSIVVALGGNALQPPGERGDIHQQFAHTRESLGAVVALAGAGWHIAIVHGNGPQIGDELLRNEMARSERPPLPLGVLVAATAGWIGYMIQQSLENALERDGITRQVVTVITQVLIDRDDPALREPTKPIGRAMTEAEAQRLASELGWAVAPAGSGWRRVVASPQPIEFVERNQIVTLFQSGTIVIAGGGGGTPVYRHPMLGLEGVDAVIDKDRAAAVLGNSVHASTLLILTNVDAVYEDWGGPRQRPVGRMNAARALELSHAGEFGEGSMRPKIEAAVRFLRDGGRCACIARLDQGLAAVEGRAGTTIVP